MRPATGHRTGNHRRFALLATVVRYSAARLAHWDIPEVLPLPAPAIFAGNHRSLFDIVVGFHLFWNYRASVRIVVAKRYFDHWLMGPLLRTAGFIPMEPGRAALGGVKASLAALDRGETVVLMPEGRVIPPEERPEGVGPPSAGIGILAARSDAPLGICAITGTDEVWPLGRRFPYLRLGRTRPTVRVLVEALEPLEARDRRDRDCVATAVMVALAERVSASEGPETPD
ncbi:MAG: lysophospholipid acyltransferase family protein [bacterium]|nr:lysophospholipid acyltransferase family protein [bacterium]